MKKNMNEGMYFGLRQDLKCLEENIVNSCNSLENVLYGPDKTLFFKSFFNNLKDKGTGVFV